MMKPNDNNNKDVKSILRDIIFNRTHTVFKEGDVIDIAKALGIPNWDPEQVSNVNNLDNVKIGIYPEPQSRSEISIDDLYDELKTPKYNTFETLYKRWKDLNFICSILDDTIYVESIDKSKFFILTENSFTIKSNNDKGVTLNLFTLQLILDTIDYLIDDSIPDEDNDDDKEE